MPIVSFNDFSQLVNDTVVWNNTVFDYLLAVGIFLVLVFLFKAVQWLAVKSLSVAASRTKTDLDDALLTVVKTIKPPFYTFVAFYLALQYLAVKGAAEKVVTFILVFWSVYQVIMALCIVLDYYLDKHFIRDSQDRTAAAQLIRNLSTIILWSIGLLFILQNIGINATSILAGLGVGGIAVALAAKNILTDLFSSLVIYFDQPFAPGDSIEVSGRQGTVVRIGIKTTRLRAASGEEIIVPNTQLTDSLIINYGRSPHKPD